ncbi:hypothetical protein [Photorhabdus bodei]|uniref:Uncharacterized protein n=1 Tax=Photorhabdus bodei TaxID=2029681 RepID=A0AAW6BN86_9GAMM|nr:hypothetical protein [Photorhabdus bodei]MDB6374261.1 hypothetical protein [Photorhabdus bodei]
MKALYCYFLLFFSMPGLADITPAVTLPRNKSYSVITREISENTLGIQLLSISGGRCNIKFQDLFYGTVSDEVYFKKYSPISSWVCLTAGEVFEAGYDTVYSGNLGRDISHYPEKVVYDYEHQRWVLEKDELYEKIEGKEPISLNFHLISSKNAKGYAVFDNYIFIGNAYAKKGLYFCMVHDYSALCGWGDMIHEENGKKIDLTPYALKLIESISFID